MVFRVILFSANEEHYASVTDVIERREIVSNAVLGLLEVSTCIGIHNN